MKNNGFVLAPLIIIVAALVLIGTGTALLVTEFVQDDGSSDTDRETTLSNESQAGDTASERDLALYSDPTHGFSLRIPEYYYSYDGNCVADQSGNYVRTIARIPSAYFWTNENFYLTRQYYFEPGDASPGPDGSTLHGSCAKKSSTVATVQQADQEWQSWKFEFGDARNNDDLNQFIKAKWGEGCSIESQFAWPEQAGVYQVSVQGDGLDLSESSCQLNYAYRLLYHPLSNRVVAWNRGQEPLF